MPIIVWVMMGYFESLPQELEDAALIDGATLWQAFATWRCRWPGPASWWRRSSPSSSPGTTSSSRVVLGGKETRTLPVAVYNVLTFEQLSWGPLAAAALLVTAAGAARSPSWRSARSSPGLTAGGLKDG